MGVRSGQLALSRKLDKQGYTLVELMVVVVIIGILAAIAIPTYQSYMNQAKANEAVSFLVQIKYAQEGYFSRRGFYCNASGTATNLNPASAPGPDPAPWTPHALGWDDIAAYPAGGHVLFRYVTVAGGPGVDPTALGLESIDAQAISTGDPWFYAAAYGDLDGDGHLMTFSIGSGQKTVYSSEESGWE